MAKRILKKIAQKTAQEKLVDVLKQDKKKLEALVEKQQERIEALRKGRISLPVGAKKSSKKGASYLRLIVPDTHGNQVDRRAWGAMIQDARLIQPAEVVMLGDVLECGGYLAKHHVMGFVPELAYCYTDDINAANVQLDEIQSLKSDPDVIEIEGNHEHRIEQQIIKTTGNKKDAERMMKVDGPRAVLNIEKRGIRWVARGRKQPGEQVRGCVRLGKCYFTHGVSIAKHAASIHAQKFGTNVVYGHTHRADMWVERSVGSGSYIAACPGCLSQLQPTWKHNDVTTWTHGYGIQVVSGNGNFLHINVPIRDGVSFLEPLVQALKG